MRSIQFLKRTVSRALLALAVGLTAIGAEPVVAQEEELQGEIRFSWWGGPQRNEKTDKIISMFEDLHPGVSIVREQSDWNGYWDRLNVQSAGGNVPCSLQMQSRWFAQYARPNILMPLQRLVEDGSINVEGVPRGIMESGYGPDGNLYMIPTGAFFHGLLFNRTLAEEAGVPIPDASKWTWDDLYAWLRAMSEELPEGVRASSNLGISQEVFVTYVQSHGYEVFDENSALGFPQELMVEWFETWDKLRQEGVVQSADMMSEESGDTIEESGIANGRLVVQPRPANRLDAHQNVLENVKPGQMLDLLTFPHGPDGSGDDIGTNGLSIGANCSPDNTQISIEWINFFLQDPGAAEIYASDNGVVSVERFQTAQLEAEDASRGQKTQIRALKEVSKDAKSIYYPAGGFQAFDDAIQSSMQALAFGQMTAEEAVANFFSEVDRMVD